MYDDVHTRLLKEAFTLQNKHALLHTGHVSFAVIMCLLKIYPCDILYKHEINADIVVTPENTLGNHYRKLASL